MKTTDERIQRLLAIAGAAVLAVGAAACGDDSSDDSSSRTTDTAPVSPADDSQPSELDELLAAAEPVDAEVPADWERITVEFGRPDDGPVPAVEISVPPGTEVVPSIGTGTFDGLTATSVELGLGLAEFADGPEAAVPRSLVLGLTRTETGESITLEDYWDANATLLAFFDDSATIEALDADGLLIVRTSSSIDVNDEQVHTTQYIAEIGGDVYTISLTDGEPFDRPDIAVPALASIVPLQS